MSMFVSIKLTIIKKKNLCRRGFSQNYYSHHGSFLKYSNFQTIKKKHARVEIIYMK